MKKQFKKPQVIIHEVSAKQNILAGSSINRPSSSVRVNDWVRDNEISGHF